jgi:hypothetical protein
MSDRIAAATEKSNRKWDVKSRLENDDESNTFMTAAMTIRIESAKELNIYAGAYELSIQIFK